MFASPTAPDKNGSAKYYIFKDNLTSFIIHECVYFYVMFYDGFGGKRLSRPVVNFGFPL